MEYQSQQIGNNYGSLQYSSSPMLTTFQPNQQSQFESNQFISQALPLNEITIPAPSQKPDVYSIPTYSYVTQSVAGIEQPKAIPASQYSSYTPYGDVATTQTPKTSVQPTIIRTTADFGNNIYQSNAVLIDENKFKQSDFKQSQADWNSNGLQRQTVGEVIKQSPQKTTASVNGLATYQSTNFQPYNVTTMDETNFESILIGKNNEIDYWKQKCLKSQKQLEDSDVKLSYLSTEYDKLRAQFLGLQENQDQQKQLLQMEIEKKDNFIQSFQQQYNNLNDLYNKVCTDNGVIKQQKLESEFKSNDLQRQITELQLKNQNLEQEEVVKRANKPIFDNKQSVSSSRVVVVDNQNQGKESEIIRAQFEMIDRQNGLIEYQKQQIIEKDQKIGTLQQELWDHQQMVNSSKGRSIFC